MNFHLDLIEDKIEFFEANSLKNLEKKISEQIDINRAILLTVYSVTHQMLLTDNGQPYYSAVVHFKLKK
ncbi:YrzA family protein [Neobacillus sp. PS3-40]|uniref:YrzA family protein n=1 Tax=Neobacillus sp. PS3-40 TaxID=3070679 RepID=UPI0027DFD04C|nr:YrzA family protein [Neobacillus sp. PS3-40]WML45481.1 YrzA family protein [Neobacillus sp. PS3-40]